AWHGTHRSLSLGQQRLWGVHAFKSGIPVYNICIAYRLSGSLDTECFERALRALFDRHKTLRTSFGMVDKRPMQAIWGTPVVVLTRVDLRHLPATDCHARSQTEPAAEEELAWWSARLENGVQPLELPGDRRPVSVPSDCAGRQDFNLPGGLVSELSGFALRQNTTLYVVSLAALATLLWQETSQEDLVICSPVVGRRRSASRG